MSYDFVEIAEHLDQIQEKMQEALENDEPETAIKLFEEQIKYKGIIEDLIAKGDKLTPEEEEFKDKYLSCLMEIGELTLEFLEEEKENARKELIQLGIGRKGQTAYQTVRRRTSK